MTNVNRDLKFGKLLAIARILGERVFERGKPAIPELHFKKYSKKPVEVFGKLHENLMQYAHEFGDDEIQLLDLFGEVLSEMSVDEYTNDPLSDNFLIGYYSQGHTLDNITSVKSAAELLGLAEGSVKNMCASNKIPAKKIGNTWVVDKVKLEIIKKIRDVFNELDEEYLINGENNRFARIYYNQEELEGDKDFANYNLSLYGLETDASTLDYPIILLEENGIDEGHIFESYEESSDILKAAANYLTKK